MVSKKERASSGKKLTKEEVLHVAKLANLELSDKEVEKFQEQLSEVLTYVSQLDGVDTSGVEATGWATGSKNRMEEDGRSDSESLTSEEAISGAKRKLNGCFVVPGILNKE